MCSATQNRLNLRERRPDHGDEVYLRNFRKIGFAQRAWSALGRKSTANSKDSHVAAEDSCGLEAKSSRAHFE